MEKRKRRVDSQGPGRTPFDDYLDCLAVALARWWLRRCRKAPDSGLLTCMDEEVIEKNK